MQAEGIVKHFNWYPGIDAKNVKASSTRRPGTSSSPTSRRTTCQSKGKPFPIAPYFNDILEAYERKVAN